MSRQEKPEPRINKNLQQLGGHNECLGVTVDRTRIQVIVLLKDLGLTSGQYNLKNHEDLEHEI